METIADLPAPTLERYLRHIATFHVNIRIQERRLRRGEWRIWHRYRRTGRDSTLAALQYVIASNDAADSGTRITRLFA